ncbi:MAG: hypothetical protein M3Z10_14350 [Gemmatimonadota bacterium]|nr:hypothetical protein [Gemmatimonadota bacterium]
MLILIVRWALIIEVPRGGRKVNSRHCSSIERIAPRGCNPPNGPPGKSTSRASILYSYALLAGRFLLVVLLGYRECAVWCTKVSPAGKEGRQPFIGTR